MCLEIIPAIDLMGEHVVRLLRGNPDSARDYSDNPLAVAEKWVEMGARRLHVVDLDATLSRGDNISTIRNLLTSVKVPIQVGGGIRDIRQASELLLRGVDRVILSTLAINDRNALSHLLHNFGNRRIVVALDYLSGEVMIKGWREATGLRVIEAMTKFHISGVDIFLVTAIQRDGTLEGADYETLRRAIQTEGVEIIASGGIRTVEELLALKRIGVKAAILGRAIYDGSIDLAEAVKRVGGD
jgi:phosphoribosylformimino-5-aminoimidazole carboxamide ribotide isomerase